MMLVGTEVAERGFWYGNCRFFEKGRRGIDYHKGSSKGKLLIVEGQVRFLAGQEFRYMEIYVNQYSVIHMGTRGRFGAFLESG